MIGRVVGSHERLTVGVVRSTSVDRSLSLIFFFGMLFLLDHQASVALDEFAKPEKWRSLNN